MAAPNHKGPPLLPSESGYDLAAPGRSKFGGVTTTSRNSTTTTTTTTSNSYSKTSRRHPSPLVSRTVVMTPQPPQAPPAKRPQTPPRRQPNAPSPAVKRPGTPERGRPRTTAPAASERAPSTERRRPSTPGINSGERAAGAGKPKSLGSSLSRRSLSFSFQGEISDSFPVSEKKPVPAGSQVGGIRKTTPANSKPTDQWRWPSLREVNNTLAKSNSGLKHSVMEDAAGLTARFDPLASDAESVYSERSVHEQERRRFATFSHETSKPKNHENNTLAPLKINPSSKVFIDSPISTPPSVSSGKNTFFSPFRGASRPASPSRRPPNSAPSTPRGTPSPSRTRGGANDNLSNVSSVLSLDEYLSRLMCNRYLQWRFLNARADVEINFQKITTEKSLYNAWVATLKLRRSVASKRAEIQLLQRSLKLSTILKGQMQYLNDWDLIEGDNSSSLSGATNALVSSTLRLPVVGGARANIQNVKDAIGSAVNVMQAMSSSIGSFLPKVDKVYSVVSELARVTSQERAFLQHCEDLLSMLIAVQVRYCSMRTHMIQLSSDGGLSLGAEVPQADLI